MPENAQVILQASTLPEGACFSSEQLRLNAFVAAMTGELPGNYSTFNSGNTTPAVNDRDKPWVRTNADGSPDGVYNFFDGAWRRPAPLPGPGFIGLWLGTAGAVDTLDGGTAGVATIYTGPFWEIVVAFAARSPMGVGTLPSGQAIVVGAEFGEEKHTLLTTELPEVLGGLKAPFDKLIARRTSGGTASLAASGAVGQDDFNDVVKGGDDTPHNTVHPVLGAYFIRRTARLYINAT